MIKDLRAPLTNLNTAAENLKSYPEMTADMRSIFEDIFIKESAELTRRFESVVYESSNITNMQWPLFDVHSVDIIGCVVRKFTEEDGITLTMIGVPLWLHADSYSLMLVLDFLVRFVQKSCNVSEIDIEALLGDRRVYIDIVWKGKPIPQPTVDDAVLVAHNGAFDMNFFRLLEEESGARFESPILDTLLLAIIVDKERTDYTLENITLWLGVDDVVCQTTMGDCFITAQMDCSTQDNPYSQSPPADFHCRFHCLQVCQGSFNWRDRYHHRRRRYPALYFAAIESSFNEF